MPDNLLRHFVVALIVNVIGWTAAYGITMAFDWTWNPYMVMSYILIGIMIEIVVSVITESRTA